MNALARARSITLLALGLASTLGSAPARAATGDEARAEDRFHEGERLFEAKDYAAAASALLESEQLDPQLGTLINLALCHEALGRAATAMREFEIAATWAAARKQSDREQYARQHAAELSKRASVLHLSLPQTAGAYAIALDGEPVAPSQWPLPVFLDPGAHTVRITAPGHQPAEVPLSVGVGSDVSLTIPTLAPLPAEGPAPVRAVAPREPGSDLRRPVGLMAAGVGVVALSLASYLWAHDGQPSAEAIAAAAAGGIVLGGGAYLTFTASPSAPSSRASGPGAGAFVSAVW